MLSGRYPSDEFAELRPRITWDRVTGVLTARPGAQRLAVTSGGTIPDRGLFGVFLAGTAGEPGRRVGELDEEMVYESRVGDVFLLGTSSWRIEDITHDRVLVTPAPGRPGRLPFWKGDALGRPLELGRAVGAFVREIATADRPVAADRDCAPAGLDDWAAANLLAYLAEQREATGQLPDDRTIVVERFRDELGDWRLVVHSPFGAQVNAPWALAIGARLRERYGVDVAAMHADDGIVLRLPETDAEPPDAGLAVFDPDEIEALVTAEVGGSALFAARFRECAARALLLPRRDPRRRAPLWQQRQRAAQLLQVASEYGSFPIVLETMRECLQDVFDVPGLVELMRDLRSRRLRLVEVETPQASPFAQSLLFGYVGEFLYEGDAPLAERRAQALSLDTALLAELLGQAELRELLDPDALAEVEAELQRLTEYRHAFDVDATADLLRLVGDLTDRRGRRSRGAGRAGWPSSRRPGAPCGSASPARSAGSGSRTPAGCATPSASRCPSGCRRRSPSRSATRSATSSARYARTHGPFHVGACAARLGLGTAVVADVLHRLAGGGRVVSGEFRPGGSGLDWCDAEVLRTLRRRSLAGCAARSSRCRPRRWPGSSRPGSGSGASSTRGSDALARAIEQLAGVAVPASALETLVLPARMSGYAPAMLDELTAAGEVLWSGAGALPGRDGWVSLAPTDIADLVLPAVDTSLDPSPVHEAVLDALGDDAALFFRGLADRVFADGAAGPPDDAALVAAIWDLVWAGRLTNDTLAPLRTLLGAGKVTHPRRPAPPRSRYGRVGRPPMPSRTGPPTAAGRWSRLPDRISDPTPRAHAVAETLLDRHGVVTRGAVAAEHMAGGFAAAYRVLRAFEDAGRVRRGYFVAGLGAAQFATTGAVDRLRTFTAERPARAPGPPDGGRRGVAERQDALVLAATDPANAYGAALPWPERPEPSGHRPGRKAGALVVLVDGRLVLYVERGGRSLLSWSDDPALLQPAADALALAVRDGGLGRMAVERADGAGLLDSPLARALESAGFRPTPRGLRLRSG